MRILVTHPDNPYHESTWSRAPFNLCNALTFKGHDVYPVACGRSNLLERVSFRIRQKLRGSDYTYSTQFRKYSRELLKNFINSIKPDAIIHCATTSSVIDKNEITVPQYLYCDSTWNRYIKYSLGVPPSSIIINDVNRLESLAYSNINHIFTFSSAVKDDLNKFYKISESKVSVVGSGCGHMSPYYGDKNYNLPNILYVGVRSPEQKGAFLLIESFKIALKYNPKMSLTIEGGSVPEKYSDNIQQIKIVGKSSRKELESYFINSSLFAMPAIFEPWGNVYLEALSFKTPILGLNRHSLPDITDNGRFGFLINNPRPEIIAKYLISALSNPARLESMGTLGQKHILTNYTWSRVSELILNKITNNF